MNDEQKAEMETLRNNLVVAQARVRILTGQIEGLLEMAKRRGYLDLVQAARSFGSIHVADDPPEGKS